MSHAHIRTNVYWCQPGDEFKTHTGVMMHREPKLIVPGHQPAAAFFVEGQPMAVLVIRQGESKFRYVDREYVLHEDAIAGDSLHAMMTEAMKRVAQMVAAYVGGSAQVSSVRPAAVH